MALKLTAESFLAGVKQSGLIEPERLDETVRDAQRHGVNVDDSSTLAEELIRRNVITAWQSEKLLQGKYKGFVLGRYKLLALLGKGEMSAVYLAEHMMMRRRCAIKVLPANKVKDTSYLGRFQREAQAVAALDCPNIVRAYDVDMEVDNGIDIHYLVMEYFAGKDLEKMRHEKGQLDVITATDYARQAAEGLAHAHQAGMVHRDIKPENLLVDARGVVKILDLGLARLDNGQNIESLTIKHNEKVLGTADYLAPEQAIDSHKVDARADIYSLGCTFYFLLTGHPPFTDGTLVQRLLAHQTRVPPAVQKERPDVPAEIIEVLEKAMAKKAEDRFQSAREMADALSTWLVNYAGNEWRKKHPAIVAAIAGIDAMTAGYAVVAPTNNLPAPGARNSNAPPRKRRSSDILRDEPEFDPLERSVPSNQPLPQPVSRDPGLPPGKRKPMKPTPVRTQTAVAAAARPNDATMRSVTPTQRITSSTTPSWPAEAVSAVPARTAPPRPRTAEAREVQAVPAKSSPSMATISASRPSAVFWNQKLTIFISLILTALLLVCGIGYGLYAAHEKDVAAAAERESLRASDRESVIPSPAIGAELSVMEPRPN